MSGFYKKVSKLYSWRPILFFLPFEKNCSKWMPFFFKSFWAKDGWMWWPFFIQEAQIFNLSPFGKVAHCKLGYLLVLLVGLYFPRKRFLLAAIVVPFLQVGQVFI